MALINSLGSGVAALSAFSKGLAVIGDNIANVNTTGYKGSRTDYEDSFSQILKDPAPSTATASNTSAMQVGTGVNVGSVRAGFTQGSLQATGIASDLGISGNGFFVIRDTGSNQQFLTRAGDFHLDDKGNLISNEGLRVQGLNDGAITYDANVDAAGNLVFTLGTSTAPTTVGDIKIDAPMTIAGGQITDNTGGAFTQAQIEAMVPHMSSYTVDTSGNVVVTMSDGQSFNRGQVLLQNVQDTSALKREGGNKFSGAAAAGPIGGLALSAANNTPGTAGVGKIQSGALELSNVDITQQFADMITAQRSFQAGSRVITVSDQVLEEVVNLKR